jgi:hypothetical protein
VSVTFTKDFGRYNFAGTEKSYCVTLRTPFGNASQTWPLTDEPSIDGCLPSDVLDLIEARLKSYLWTSFRERDGATIAAIREHANEIDIAYVQGRIAAARKAIERDERLLAELMEEAS